MDATADGDAVNLLLLTSHAIAEYDDLRMFSDMGVNVFSIGGAYDEVPFEGKRPRLDAPVFPEFVELNHRHRAEMTERYGDPGPRIDWAKAYLHPDILDWADSIVVHHFPEHWIAGQWSRIKGKRVIWRTCGQSNPALEQFMGRLDGLEIVRYSPAERHYFERVGAFAGEDAVIRFGKYPADYGPWTGEDPVTGNVTQNMVERGDACGLSFWLAATEGLPTRPAGPGSELLPGGIGALAYDEMLEYLRRCRAYLYTGTTPASYTLGLIEAALSGVPIVSIPAVAWPGPRELFEGWEFASEGYGGDRHGRPGIREDPVEWARVMLRKYLDDPDRARNAGFLTRDRAISTFGIDTISGQWGAFLGVPARQAVAA